jgi:hypothetical protein
MSIKVISIKHIQITFQYLSQFITLISERYKTLRQEKIKAMNKMIGVPNSVYCSYLGVNLTKDENKKIGDIFSHKEKVLIILKVPKIISPPNNRIMLKRSDSQHSSELNEIKSTKLNNDNNFQTFFDDNTILTTNKNSLSPKYDSIPKKLKKSRNLK